MNAEIYSFFKDEEGEKYYVGDTVSITWNNGGGIGSCKISKITKTGFWYTQGTVKEKSAQFSSIKVLSLYTRGELPFK